jgi:hypothetical protein
MFGLLKVRTDEPEECRIGSLILEQLSETREDLPHDDIAKIAEECGLDAQVEKAQRFDRANRKMQKATEMGYRKLVGVYDYTFYHSFGFVTTRPSKLAAFLTWAAFPILGVKEYTTHPAKEYCGKMPVHAMRSYALANSVDVFDAIDVWERTKDIDPYLIGRIIRDSVYHFYFIDSWEENEPLI